MKIIEGMKKLKDLTRKAADLRAKIATYCADLTTDTPTYKTEDDQRQMIAGWLQGHHDITREIENLRVALTKTNCTKTVAITMSDDTTVTKTIQAWILRRRELSVMDLGAWKGLTNRGLKDQAFRTQPNAEDVSVAHVRRYYDQEQRDKKVELYMAEPALIDAALEVFNATTDLVEE